MAGMKRNSWIVAGLATLVLGGCVPGTANGPQAAATTGDLAVGGTAAVAPAATSVRLVDHDVEAPEVYQATDKGLWDGRPSLGGVWVASSDAKTPERVIMRNPANGKFVIGGLFQRDASLPGPKLQLSSDAADALGLVAGQPAVVKVTALRRNETPAPTPDATKPLLDTNAAPAGTTTAGTTTNVAATATAAIDKAAAGKPTATAIALPTPGAKPAVALASVAGAKPAAATAQPTPSVPAAKPATQVAALPAPPLAKPAAQPLAALGAAPAIPAAPSASGALIMIGIYSVEANSKRASDVLTKAGVVSTTTQEISHDKPMWSLTARGDAALLAKVKAAGFKDAFVLRR